MRHRFLALLISAFSMFALTACVNLKPTPSITKSYTLGPVDGLNPLPQTRQLESSIYIIRPQLPTFLDGAWLSYRSTNGEVNRMTTARWAEPLAEGIARAVSLYLSESGLAPVDGYYPWPNTSKNSSRLSLHFKRLGALESGQVQVVARWTLRGPEGENQRGYYASDELVWTVGEPDSLVAAYNQALKELAAEVGKAVAEK